MNVLKTALFALLLACAPAAFADAKSEREALAGELLDSLGTEQMLREMTTMVMDMQLESHPELQPFRGIMTDFMERHMSYKALRQDFIDIYVAEFTAEELRAARDFYASPEGQRFVTLQPKLMEMGSALGERRVQENAGELTAAIAAEKARLDAEAEGGGKAAAGAKGDAVKE